MNCIFVDFEMQPIVKECRKERAVCPREVIEFGAVMLDENHQEIASFREYVRPQYTKRIYPSIALLTGITQEKIAGAAKFNSVFTRFVSWCSAFNKEFTVYAWSKSDLDQITKEMCLKGTVKTDEINAVLTNWVDFQKEYCELIQTKKQLSLEKALNSAGQCFIGKKHDALWDARNTAELFRISRNQDELFKTRSSINHIVDQEDNKCHYTLGDMVDLSKFCFA